jgi:hypothetical protein
MTTFRILNDYLMTTSNLLMTTSTTSIYIEYNNNTHLKRVDSAYIRRKSSKSSFTSIKAIIKPSLSPLLVPCPFRFFSAESEETRTFRSLLKLKALFGLYRQFYVFCFKYYIKEYLKIYIKSSLLECD